MWGNRVVDLLIKALKDNDEGVRRYATEVLGRIRKAELRIREGLHLFFNAWRYWMSRSTITLLNWISIL